MLRIKKIQKSLLKTLENNQFSTKIRLYFSSKIIGEFFDSYERVYTHVNQNPITIKGYVTEISAEALVWKQYGLSEIGAKEITCNKKYAPWFKLASKIEIDGDSYQTYKENVGGKFLISELPLNLVKIIVMKAR